MVGLVAIGGVLDLIENAIAWMRSATPGLPVSLIVTSGCSGCTSSSRASVCWAASGWLSPAAPVCGGGGAARCSSGGGP
jgi:hypothetical protein